MLKENNMEEQCIVTSFKQRSLVRIKKDAREFGDDVALVEINPDVTETRRVTWREYELIEANPTCQYRREITWNVFNEKANRFANLLVSRGIQKASSMTKQPFTNSKRQLLW